MDNNKETSLDKIRSLIKLEKKEIASIYFYAILHGLIQLSLPLGIQSILNFILGATMVTSIYLLIAVIILAVFFIGLLQINQMKIIEKIQQKIFVRYAFRFANTIPKFDLKDTQKYYLPEKINRFFDTITIQKNIAKLLLDIPTALIQIIFGLILLSLYHPLFILFSILLFFIIWIIFKYTSPKGIKSNYIESNNKFEVLAWLQEMGRVLKSLKYFKGDNVTLAKTDDKVLQYLKARTDHFKILLFQFKSMVFFKVSITTIMLILGTYLMYNQLINVGQFVAAELIILTIISSLEKIINSLESVYDILTAFDKLDSVLNTTLEKSGNITFTKNYINVEVKNLSFSYNESEPIFDKLNLIIEANKLTCISGEENSGKSSLLKLLTGTYQDFKGNIFVNEIPIQNYDLQSLRAKTGVLLYEQDIFNGTVFENIALGREEVTIESLLILIKEIGIDNFISALPHSFETKIDPLGGNLPASTIKKILLLRALAGNSIFIVFEEPWIKLDEFSKKSVQNYLIKIATNKTVIVSTNDKEFTELSNHHIHLENGNAFIKK